MRVTGKKLINHYDVQIAAPWKRTNRRSDEPLFRRALLKLVSLNGKVIQSSIFNLIYLSNTR